MHYLQLLLVRGLDVVELDSLLPSLKTIPKYGPELIQIVGMTHFLVVYDCVPIFLLAVSQRPYLLTVWASPQSFS